MHFSHRVTSYNRDFPEDYESLRFTICLFNALYSFYCHVETTRTFPSRNESLSHTIVCLAR